MPPLACTPEGGRGPEIRLGGGASPKAVELRGDRSLTFGLIGEPSTLDPYARGASDLTYALVRPLYPSLYRLRPDGEPTPYLAERLERVDGGAIVTLRSGRWSDGSDIEVADVIASIARASKPSGFARVEGATRVDRRRLRLEGRIRDWERSLATLAYVLPDGRAGERFGGPLVLSRHRPGLELVYTTNQEWFGPPGPIERVTVRLMDDLEGTLRGLRSGELDAAALPTTVNLPQRLAASGLESAAALGWERVKIVFAENVPEEVVRAVSGTLDRELLARSFIRAEGELDGRVSGGGKMQSFPSAFSLGVPGGDELLSLLQRAVQVQLEHLGQVDLVSIDGMTFYSSWQADPPVDALLMRRGGAPGIAQASRRDLPLFRVMTSLAWRPGVSGMDPNPTVDGPLWNVERWSVTR